MRGGHLRLGAASVSLHACVRRASRNEYPDDDDGPHETYTAPCAPHGQPHDGRPPIASHAPPTQDFPLLQPDRAYCGPRLTPIKETPQSGGGRSSLFMRKRLLADLDDLAKDLDVVKLQSAAKPQRPGEDCMAISPRH